MKNNKVSKVHRQFIKELAQEKGIDYTILKYRGLDEANELIHLLQQQTKEFIINKYSPKLRGIKEQELEKRRLKTVAFNKNKRRRKKRT